VLARSDGWQAYRVLNSESSFHVTTVTGSGKNAGRLFSWVHSLIANVKGNIRGVYHGVALPRLKSSFAGCVASRIMLPNADYRTERRVDSEVMNNLYIRTNASLRGRVTPLIYGNPGIIYGLADRLAAMVQLLGNLPH
jgi:hypothetical protein